MDVLAEGDAELMIRSAVGYALERGTNAGGETARFVALNEE